ncbi:AbrB/MazE/SpoVT family DNA-binding domain-containing protein [Candidatus Woesearchaeota archaeon]|nr:AbrB/MazE/SpoVT family DNA-binding domain-containing protein [Candidatus Woesearchaeota archaeon]
MTEIVTMGEKGQIVIPKKIRKEFKMEKGTKLIIIEEKDRLIIKPIKIDEEDYFWLLSGENSLNKTWDNEYDKRWDDVL